MLKKLFLLLMISTSLKAEVYDWKRLHDLTLQNSPLIAQKNAQIRGSQMKIIEARSKALPTLNFESNLSYINNPDSLTVKAGEFGTLPPPLSTSLPDKDKEFSLTANTLYQFKLIFDQPLFTWGKIYNAIRATKEGNRAATMDRAMNSRILAGEIKINLLTLKHMQEIRGFLERLKEITYRLEEISNDSYGKGMILHSDYLASKIGMSQANQNRSLIEEQIGQIILNLSLLTGIELKEEELDTQVTLTTPSDDWQHLFSQALGDNEGLAALRHQVKATEYKSLIKKGEFYFKPDLALHMELSYGGSHFPFIQEGWLDKDKGNFTLTVAIRSPLADFGGLYSAIESDKEEWKGKMAAYENEISDLEKNIRLIMSALRINKINITHHLTLIQAQEEMIEQKRKEWISGYGSERDFLEKEIDLYREWNLLKKEKIEEGKNLLKLEILGSL